MTTVTVEEAQSGLLELLLRLRPGEELTITAGGEPVAQLKRGERHSQPGCYKLPGFWMAPDFNEPIDDFAEYM